MADYIHLLHEDGVLPDYRTAKCIRFVLPQTISPDKMEPHIAALHAKGWITRMIHKVKQGADWQLWKNNHICHEHCVCNNWIPNTCMYVYPDKDEIYVGAQEVLRQFTKDMNKYKLEYGVSLYNF
jgi:hypothetical protein